MQFLEGLNLDQLDKPEFKEDSVREEIVIPILNELGYKRGTTHNITSHKKLDHPFVKIGSRHHPIKQYPDYLMQVDDLNAWVLDAKSPTENIIEGENVEQVYSYAIHPEVRTRLFALCNGREFIAFKIDKKEPVIYFHISELDKYFTDLLRLLGATEFIHSVSILSESRNPEEINVGKFDYLSRPLLKEIKVRKQAVKRHFGVHGYFTKQVWNVVSEYIRNYTRPGDLVLDPFGGSGVTAVEALMLDRKAIHIDLNPLSPFLVHNLTSPVNIEVLSKRFEHIRRIFKRSSPQTKSEIEKALKIQAYPKGIKLSKDSDVKNIEELFTKKQLAQLGFLKKLIKSIKEPGVRDSLLLAFSSTLTKINLTYHPSKSRGVNAGDSSAFRYYRYRIAREAVNLDILDTFETKVKKVIAAKREIEYFITKWTIDNLQCYKGDAANLSNIDSESVDYIYTDPPYGSKIPYLDLSVMWNGWLDFKVRKGDYKAEIIEGGSHNQTKSIYSTLLTKSIQEMYRVLKFDRWLSFVFAHKDPYYWHLIVNAAENAGFEFAGAVKQDNGQSSFKKRQHSFTVLSDQLILNFKKVKNPRNILRANVGSDISSLILETIESTIAKSEGATIDEINEALVVQGLELGFLDLLSKEYKDITPILKENFDYDDNTHKYIIKEKSKFKTHVPIELRIKYFLLSFLRRRVRENNLPDFDEIILNILPLLKNGTTPEHQTILSVLVEVGEKTSDGKWGLKSDDNQIGFL